jgi:hypothetical protein
LFTVPQNKDLKRLVRTRMAETGQNYTQALAGLQDQIELEPLPPAWRITGNRAPEYEAGLLPEVAGDADRIARLRLRPAIAEPTGFGALMQSIAAARYAGRRVSFSAMIRVTGVTEAAGLWLRVDGPHGTLAIDNMEDRSLRGTTDWTQARIVLDVAEQARTLLFGALLRGAGAIDLSRLRFEEASAAEPVTVPPLPDEPQSLDFGAPAS